MPDETKHRMKQPIDSAAAHTVGSLTNGKLVKTGDGTPPFENSTNTDAEVAAAVAASHAAAHALDGPAHTAMAGVVGNLTAIGDAAVGEGPIVDAGVAPADFIPVHDVWVSAYNDTGQAIATPGPTQLVLDVEEFDVGGDFAANTFTAPANGYYWVITGLRVTAHDGAWAVDSYVHLMIYKNAGSVRTARLLARDSSGGTTADIEVSKLIYLAATDTIKIYVQPSEDVDVVAGLQYTFLCISKAP